MTKLSIYISTFDGYSDLWDSFFTAFDKFFPDCPYNVYMTTNHKSYQRDNLKIIKTGQETTWMNRIKASIYQVDSEYILFMLEDYLIGKKVDTKEIEEIIDFMDNNAINYYRLQDIPRSQSNYKNINYLGKINSKQKYGINTICSIWKKEFLIEIINHANGVESAWDFEVYLCNRFNSLNKKYIPNCCVDKRDILAIKNGVYRGVWFKDTVKYFKKCGLDIDTKDRKIMSTMTQFKFNVKTYISNNMTIRQKDIIKSILRKCGLSFLSDKKIGGLK